MNLFAAGSLSKDPIVVSAEPTTTRHTQKSFRAERGDVRERAGMRSPSFTAIYLGRPRGCSGTSRVLTSMSQKALLLSIQWGTALSYRDTILCESSKSPHLG